MRFLTIFKNRIRVILSDRMFIAAMLIIPLILALIMGYAQREEKLGYVPMAMVDEDGSTLSKTLVLRISQKEGLKVFPVNREEADELLENEKAEVAVFILEGFETAVESGKTHGILELVRSPSTVSGEVIKEIVAAEVMRLKASEFAYDWISRRYQENSVKSKVSRQEIRDHVESYWKPVPPMTIAYEEIKGDFVSMEDVSIPSHAAASAGVLVLFVMLTLIFGSGWICEERSNGTLSRIFSSPGGLLPVFMGNTLALFVLGLFQTLFFVAIQRILFGVIMLEGIYPWLVMASYILCAAAVSMLMSSLFKTAAQLQAVAPVFSIITGLMGGCLWNLGGIPRDLQPISRLTPQGWALAAITALYASPDQSGYALPSIRILLAATVVMLILSYLFLRISRKEGTS
ncbi:MAG: ABC transporter permease [Clostridiaceae bacterium]|jgi:ABC-2 type transport system permease protein|nr:ABC transporter permease [Bacillota bacterium]NLI37759.1 ABC transporter permease [Clostridiaceae bacterium]